MKIMMGVLIFLSLAILLHFILRQKRMKNLAMMMDLITKVSAGKNVQQLKMHHEAEMVLEKQNRALSYFRILDGNIIYKLGLLLAMLMLFFITRAIFDIEMGQTGLITTLIAMLIIAIILPGKLRSLMVNQRVKKLSGEIPWMVDLLAVCVQCGMSLEVAFTFLSQKMAGINPDFTPFLARLVKRTEVSGLSDALRHFYIEIPSPENRMLCAMLMQSLQYGTSLYEQLIILSREIREIQLLALEEKIGKLGAKMSVPLILFFMFPVIVVVAAPGVMRIMANV